MEDIRNFLDANKCLSEEWKAQLLRMIGKIANEPESPPSVATPDLQTFMNLIEPHEGRENIVYFCPTGHPTIGIGFNLDRSDAESILKEHGYNISQIKVGMPISDATIDSIFREDVLRTIDSVKKLVSTYESQPQNMKLVLVDMCFNLGAGGLSKFKKFIAAVDGGDYNKAADEMVDSRWYTQVGNRSKKLEKMVRGLS